MISEIVVKVGKKGEIYFPSKFRKMIDLKPGDKVRLRIEGKKIIIEKEKDIEDLLGDYVLKISIDEAEKLVKMPKGRQELLTEKESAYYLDTTYIIPQYKIYFLNI
ncbi:MAG: AbrB/MazE/SpoVT family DNA-binding domain-containing protein [Candidatus Asgardarchaeia archaeon]